MGFAIAYFTSCGITVSIPVTDSQKYDLIVDLDGVLSRVQVKTTKYKREGGYYTATIRSMGGNKSCTTVTKFDNTQVDYLFILTEDKTMYFIPAKEIASTNAIRLGPTFNKYKVEFQ